MMTPDSVSNKSSQPYKTKIIWPAVMIALVYHCIAIRALYFILTFQTKLATLIWSFIIYIFATIGITAGVHRLWTHRSYKAKLPLKILLCVLNTMCFENNIYGWARDHRTHHKYSDTDADPHNINRGFFFAHMGWLLVRKHPDVICKQKTIDLSDLLEDSVVAFQKKYFFPMGLIICFAFPTLVPWYFWNENFYIALIVTGVLRHLINLHSAGLVNSITHTWGYKPYDKYFIRHIEATENSLVSILVMGEGWHNYHHSFPWDYKTSELDSYSGNLTTAFIDCMEKIGWAYDLKTASQQTIEKKIAKTGTVTK